MGSLKDKLSAIRQDRAERRESLQKQDAIHEVDSSEDETDEGSEDSQDGRPPPPLLRPTTVGTGPGGTLPSLCLSPCTSHATFSHTGPPQRQPRPAPPTAALSSDAASTRSTGDGAGQDRKDSGPPQRPFPFSTSSAFISVARDSFLRPAPPTHSRSAKTTAAASPQQDCTTGPSTGPPQPTGTTSSGAQETSGSAPGVSKEKKEADNRRLAASDPSQTADGASVLAPLRLAAAVDMKAAAPKPSRGGAAEARHQPPSVRSEHSAATAASEPKRKRSDLVSTANTATASSQRDKAASKKT